MHLLNAQAQSPQKSLRLATGSRYLTATKSRGSEEERALHEQIRHIATRYSTVSTFRDTGQNPFSVAPHPIIDPHSPHFQARAWAKAVLNLQAEEPEKQPPRTAGVAFTNLSVCGGVEETEYQRTVGTPVFQVWDFARRLCGARKRKKKIILHKFDGVVESGEMLLVLGPLGSGCSTLLKTISGETHGLTIDEHSYINYQGICADQMHKQFRGDAIYVADQDVHFPTLTVGDTLTFAARTRAPRHIIGGVNRVRWAEHMRDVVMAMFGISHIVNSRIGDETVPGIKEAERKKVSIAEATLSRAPLQCWDDSTSGLDQADTMEFCRTLRMQTELLGATACVGICQAGQSTYDIFDKVTVLYEGRQIFFGRCDRARDFFVDMGFECPPRQTTPDFLTSMTSPGERRVRPGFEDKVPRTSEEFAERWGGSEEYRCLLREIRKYDRKYAIGGEYLEKFVSSTKVQQARLSRTSSPYTISYGQQISLCLWRNFKRLKAETSRMMMRLFANLAMGLIIGSIFYNMADDTGSFYQRGALLFLTILRNASSGVSEVSTFYAQRPIVEKHARYALYHPSAEALASTLTGIPYHVLNSIVFSIPLYFLANLRREPGAFFFFLLISFLLTLTMSMFFRTIASVSRTTPQAMVSAAILSLAAVIFSGFPVPTPYMHRWSRWISYVDPLAYGLEALIINDFHGHEFACAQFVPDYSYGGRFNRACPSSGAKAGESTVSGDAYIEAAFQYHYHHKWGDCVMIVCFIVFFTLSYFLATEFVQAERGRGEVLVIRRGKLPGVVSSDDLEASAAQPPHKRKDSATASISPQASTFHWQNVSYDVKTKDGQKRILDNVDGWVRPGTLTALMGVSGAGKTTLLETLADRVTMGVVSGNIMIDGSPRHSNFHRTAGYVQQQDIHWPTATVREALNFSALLRQPAHVSRKEKLGYVWEVIKLLDMEDYADAVIGVPGKGLNIERRRRLAIGIELATKPQLLFIDEPTTGLDSQSSWAICSLIESLTNNGLAILCTIHQPSAMLFERFDRLLLLACGGKLVYFGDIGPKSSTVTKYFEENGAFPCPEEANPAEWLLSIITAAPGHGADPDWPQIWRDSKEIRDINEELRWLSENPFSSAFAQTEHGEVCKEFAAPFRQQLWEVTKQVFEQYWRTPSCIYSRAAICLLSALLIGLVFQIENTLQGLQTQMFAVFMLMTIPWQLIQQTMLQVVAQRVQYEGRERKLKSYSWQVFILSNMIVELCWNMLMAVLIFPSYYYLTGSYRNVKGMDTVIEMGTLIFLLVWSMLLLTCTCGNMVAAAVGSAESGGNIANLALSLMLILCGVLANHSTLPRCWIFVRRVNPFAYLVSTILSAAVANSEAVCAKNEYLTFQPYPNGVTCAEYLTHYIETAGGYLDEPDRTADCRFCTLRGANDISAAHSSYHYEPWRNFGIVWAYIILSVGSALTLYWALRVPKGKKKVKRG